LKNKKVIVGIIGGTGQMGQWFKKFFEINNCEVLISGRKTKLNPIECAKQSDVVVITVPISDTLNVIKKIAPHIRKDAAIMDLTSLKRDPVKAMLRYSKSEVVGTHPIFGPSIKTIKNQVVVLCKARGSRWFNWLKNILEKNKAKVKITTPEKHDKMMSIIQGIIHFSAISLGHTLKELNVNIDEALEYSSPVYKLRMDVIGRILNQDPKLYADIEILNPQTNRVIREFSNSTKKLRKIIKKKDTKAFVGFFNSASRHLNSFKKKASEYSDFIIEKLVEKDSKKK
jgi:prephenate dehydrogenase|tara:strand:+ start:408 stop:1262 length:855 start_codon:yes stop_codon:yes gene_type:complete